MKLELSLVWLVLTCVAISVGCSQTKAPVATSGDEVSNYLDEHPELKEKQVDPGLADPTK